MKHKLLPVLLGIALLNFTGCVDRLLNPAKAKKVEFQVFINQNTVPGVEVLCKGKSGRTDNLGYCYLALQSHVDKEQKIYIKFEPLGIDTVFLLPLSWVMPIHLNLNAPPLKDYYKSISEKKDTITYFRNQLDAVSDILNNLERELDTYMEQNPKSAVAEFQKLVHQRKEELAVLYARFDSLGERYADLMHHLPVEQMRPENFSELEAIFLETVRHAGSLRSDALALDDIARANLQNQPDIDFTDIFFATGAYKLDQLSPEQRAELQTVEQKVLRFYQTTYPDRTYNQLVLHFRMIGSADGVRVGDRLWAEIAPLCNRSTVRGDGNQCLSELRADALVDYFRHVFRAWNPEMIPEAIGSKAAVPQLADQRHRKCRASFVLFPPEQRDNHTELYRMPAIKLMQAGGK
ncbi:MAG: hypothetical protein IPM36_21015 [Lewinellaceae bacterium]|nr:hypothetical protein [Lewinellaceae bacterium]